MDSGRGGLPLQEATVRQRCTPAALALALALALAWTLWALGLATVVGSVIPVAAAALPWDEVFVAREAEAERPVVQGDCDARALQGFWGGGLRREG